MKNYVSSTIEKTIQDNELIKRGDHVVLGLSGGPDSLCLFFVLLELREQLGFTMETVHVNHKFRPGAAEEDQAFVEKICEKNHIPCMSVTYDCHEMAERLGMTLEEAGRAARYQAFDKAAALHGGNVRIAVAQNMEDQCETMLFRLMRGTGPDGLGAIQYRRKSEAGFDIIRPLLDVDRNAIEAYCRENSLQPRIDHTNQDNGYTRNRIRNELIPYIEDNFNPEFKKAMIRLATALNDDREYFRHVTEDALNQVLDAEGKIILDTYGRFAKSIRHRILKSVFERAGLTENISMVHVDACDALALKGETSREISLPGDFICRIRYGRMEVFRKDREIPFSSEKKRMEAIFSKKALMEAFGTCEVEIRTRRPGDYIYLSSGRKKIKDLFIDQKVPREQRDRMELAAIGSEVLWVPGIRYSSRYRGDAEEKSDCLKVAIFVNL